jgi:hypothetical protein
MALTRDRFRRTRVRLNGRIALGILALSVGVVPALAVVAARSRMQYARTMAFDAALLRVLPAADLAITSGGAAARMPSLEGPHAAFQSGPALLDEDPANSLLAPPRSVWQAQARPHEPVQDARTKVITP